MSTARCASINSLMRRKMRRWESSEKSSESSFSAASAWAALSSRMAPRIVFSASTLAGSPGIEPEVGDGCHITEFRTKGGLCRMVDVFGNLENVVIRVTLAWTRPRPIGIYDAENKTRIIVQYSVEWVNRSRMFQFAWRKPPEDLSEWSRSFLVSKWSLRAGMAGHRQPLRLPPLRFARRNFPCTRGRSGFRSQPWPRR